MKALRRYIVAGILVWLPLGLTILLLRFAVRLMDRSLLLLPPQFRPDNILGFHIPGLGVILLNPLQITAEEVKCSVIKITSSV